MKQHLYKHNRQSKGTSNGSVMFVLHVSAGHLMWPTRKQRSSVYLIHKSSTLFIQAVFESRGSGGERAAFGQLVLMVFALHRATLPTCIASSRAHHPRSRHPLGSCDRGRRRLCRQRNLGSKCHDLLWRQQRRGSARRCDEWRPRGKRYFTRHEEAIADV